MSTHGNPGSAESNARVCYYRLNGVHTPLRFMPHVRMLSRILIWIVLLTAACFAEQQTTVPSRPDPGDLVRKAVQNEIKTVHEETDRFLFRGTKTTPKGSTTKVYVETKEATAGLVVAYNGKPLTPDQRRAEEARVARFLNNPAELKKKRNQEREDEERTLRIVRAIPDAFLFEYAGEEQGSAGIGRAGDPLVKLKFRPNPRYQPPSRVEQVLTGMQGFVLVDVARYRIASIDGTLFKDVSFGWGILGHLDRGGHFLVQQQELGDDRWDISRMSLNFTGKILLVKNLMISSTEVFSGFKKVPPDLTFAEALELLKKEETVAENPTTSKLALK
ncbi:MAG: hypothetical protein LAO22_05770 [Acidobacteriia bacterium]|nr:hypothetical protein [Terriglobia bacterium]